MGYPQDYSIENAIKDLATGKISDISFTESGGVITETPMSNGGSKVQICEPVDTERGHRTADYYYDKDGNFYDYKIHKE